MFRVALVRIVIWIEQRDLGSENVQSFMSPAFKRVQLWYYWSIQAFTGQSWMKSKYKISRANERLKVVTIEPNNKSNWKQPTKPNEYINCIFYPLWLHFWRRKTVLQFWQLILMWSSQCCLMICIYSLTLYKRDCDRLYQNVHTNPQFGRTVFYYWQSSPTSTSDKSIMQTQKGFLWILL